MVRLQLESDFSHSVGERQSAPRSGRALVSGSGSEERLAEAGLARVVDSRLPLVTSPGGTGLGSAVVQLQRQIGNRATARLMARAGESATRIGCGDQRHRGHVLQREKICVPGNENSPECLLSEYDKRSARPTNIDDLQPAADAVRGVAPYYMVSDQLPADVAVPAGYEFRFSDWLIVPYMSSEDVPNLPKSGDRTSSPVPVLYFLAWNLAAHRNELVIGPNELSLFLSHEKEAMALRNAFYWYVHPADFSHSGQPSADQIDSAKAMSAFNDGDFRKGMRLWGRAWIAQAKDPMTWVNVFIAYAGAQGPTGANAVSELEPTGVPEALSEPAGPAAATGPALSTAGTLAEPQVVLPSGQRLAPDSYSGGFYGTAEENPDVVMRDGFADRGDDWRLLEHSEGNPHSALRGTTNIASDGVGRGAAYWAGEGGYVYEIRRVPTWDVNKALQGRVGTGEGYRGNLMHGEGEYAIPSRVPPEKIVRWGIVRDLGGDRLQVEWKWP